MATTSVDRRIEVFQEHFKANQSNLLPKTGYNPNQVKWYQRVMDLLYTGASSEQNGKLTIKPYGAVEAETMIVIREPREGVFDLSAFHNQDALKNYLRKNPGSGEFDQLNNPYGAGSRPLVDHVVRVVIGGDISPENTSELNSFTEMMHQSKSRKFHLGLRHQDKIPGVMSKLGLVDVYTARFTNVGDGSKDASVNLRSNKGSELVVWRFFNQKTTDGLEVAAQVPKVAQIS